MSVANFVALALYRPLSRSTCRHEAAQFADPSPRVDEQEALAAKLLKSAERARGVAVEGDVGYGDVAWWRGIALWFLKQIVDVIDVARANDPRIRAVPLGSLRAVFKRSGKPTRKAPAPSPTPG